MVFIFIIRSNWWLHLLLGVVIVSPSLFTLVQLIAVENRLSGFIETSPIDAQNFESRPNIYLFMFDSLVDEKSFNGHISRAEIEYLNQSTDFLVLNDLFQEKTPSEDAFLNILSL